MVKFDGTHFKVYQRDPDDPFSIIDNQIWNMVVDSHEIWVGTQLGLSRLDRNTQKFYNYQFDEHGKLDTITNLSREKNSSSPTPLT